MDISVIILNYKSKGFVMNCIKSITEADFKIGERKLNYEVIVVDNNSDDKIGDFLAWQYPKVVFIQNDANVGMGAGNNVGIRRATGKYIVVMNPDTISYPDTFRGLFEYMEENKKVGVCGPKQLNPDKTVQNSCYRWPSLMIPIYRRTPLGKFRFAQKYLDRYLMKDFDHKSIREVDWLLGSFLFLRSEALDKVGIFDERYFMYFEDTDFCKRFHEHDYLVIYNPELKIIHNHTRHSAKVKWFAFFSNTSTRQHIVSWLKYLLKWGIK